MKRRPLRRRGKNYAAKWAKKYGSSAYVEAIHATGCIVARLAATPQKRCWGVPTVSHLEKTNRAGHGWRRTVCKCMGHHVAFEGRIADFCTENGITFAIMEAEASQNAEQFGHLVSE